MANFTIDDFPPIHPYTIQASPNVIITVPHGVKSVIVVPPCACKGDCCKCEIDDKQDHAKLYEVRAYKPKSIECHACYHVVAKNAVTAVRLVRSIHNLKRNIDLIPTKTKIKIASNGSRWVISDDSSTPSEWRFSK